MNERESVERIQLVKIMLDAALGKRDLLDKQSKLEMLRTWQSLVRELGEDVIEEALDRQPVSYVVICERTKKYMVLVAGSGYTCVLIDSRATNADVIWRVERLDGESAYYVSRMKDGTNRCDCASWAFHVSENPDATVAHCKHLRALASLGFV